MAKFRKKSEVVEAVQWFKHGDHPAVKHCSCAEQTSYDPITKTSSGCVCSMCGKSFIERDGMTWVVTPGNWIVSAGRGEWLIYSDQVFRREFEPTTRPTAKEEAARGGVGGLVAKWRAEADAIQPARIDGTTSHRQDAMAIIFRECATELERYIDATPSPPTPSDAPAVEPVAWAVLDKNGNVDDFCCDPAVADGMARSGAGRSVLPLYAVPAAAPSEPVACEARVDEVTDAMVERGLGAEIGGGMVVRDHFPPLPHPGYIMRAALTAALKEKARG